MTRFIIPLAVLPLFAVGPAAAQPVKGAEQLTKIAEDWKARRAAYKVVKYVLKGTIEHNLPRLRSLGDTTIAGLRFTISGATNPRKSQMTIVPGSG